MSKLEPLAELMVPDARQLSFGYMNARTGECRKRTLEDHYSRIAALSLHDAAPAAVREHFETARNLMVYSWFVYEFIMVAEFHTSASLELALRERLGRTDRRSAPGLRGLLREAIDRGLVRDDGVRPLPDGALTPPNHSQPVGDPQEYVKTLVDAVSAIRNELAHGSSMLWPGGYSGLRITAALINQLFARQKTAVDPSTSDATGLG